MVPVDRGDALLLLRLAVLAALASVAALWATVVAAGAVWLWRLVL